MQNAVSSPSHSDTEQAPKSENPDKKRVHPIFGNQPTDSPSQKSQNGHSNGNGYAKTADNLIIQQLQAELIRVKGQLDDKDRAYRKLDDEFVKNRRELEDKITELKRELSEGNTETKLSHQQQLYKQEKEYEKQIREKENQINKLEMEIKLNELERKQGDRSIGNRFMDFAEDHGAEFFAKVVEGLQTMNPGGKPVQNPTPQQLQTAFNQAAEGQKSEKSENSEPVRSPFSNAEVPIEGEIPQNGSENHKNSTQPGQLTPEQMEEVKSQIKQSLLERALHVLTNPNANFQEYAMQVQQQLALNRQNGIQLDAGTWVQMAKVLSERAIEKEITAARVAKVIEPVLGDAKKYSFMLKMMDSKQVTEKLFNQFNIEANEQVKALVVKVFDALKNMK